MDHLHYRCDVYDDSSQFDGSGYLEIYKLIHYIQFFKTYDGGFFFALSCWYMLFLFYAIFPILYHLDFENRIVIL